MKIYIAHKYEQGKELNILPVLKKVITESGHIPYVFTEEGHMTDEKMMMQKAFEKLDQSDLLLIESSVDSIGIGIEAGYFYSKRKPVVMIYVKGTKISRTLKGIVTECIEYTSEADLANKFQNYLKTL